MLFYVAYHIESPVVNRISLRIIKSLRLKQNASIPTPFHATYTQFKDTPLPKNTIRVEPSPYELVENRDLNNWELLTQRSAENLFRKNEPIIETLIGQKDLGQEKHLLIHLSNEEDIAWIIRVLFYIEELYPTTKQIESWEEYLADKNKKDDKAGKKESIAQPADSKLDLKMTEKIFSNCPDLTLQIDQAVE